ncbi:MAG: TonB-dependent receptor, partial [Bacteroidales bacterium]|nr:TonB-dependent receptor [Bacteroidales bacterium]
MKFKLLYILLIFSVLKAGAQDKITISGFIYDKQNGEVLIGANIFEIDSKTGCASNEYGFYSLTLPKTDSICLIVSFIGYEPYSATLKAENKSNLNLYLNSGIVLNEVDVNAKRTESIVEKNETGVVRLQINEIKQMPSLFGEVDIIKAYQLTPGVQSGGEAKSNIYVRGGSPDQNLILLDDVPLYYVAHFGGFFSVFNADAINDVKLIKGGFPARYGGRLSSVLDIRMNDGNFKEYKTQGTIGLLSSKISFEGPIKKDKSSFIISARKNLVPIFKMLGAGISYNFYDVNSKLNFKLSEKDRLFFSFYMGDDVIGLGNNTTNTNQKNNASWGNTLGAIRWNHVYNSKLFSNLTLSDTYYRYKNIFEYKIDQDSIQKEMSNTLLTGINDLGLKMDFTYLLNSKNNFRFGFNSILHNFIPNDETFYQTGTNISTIDLSYNSKSQALENAAYVEYELKYGFLNGNFGARYSTYVIDNKFYQYLEPRAILNLIFTETFSVKASYSKSNQFVHLLSYSGSGMPSDYWMPSNVNVAPQNSEQYSVGLAKTFHNNMFELSLESYFKSLENIIDFKPGESLLGNLDSWENVIETNGSGKNYGVELFLQKLTGKTTGWVGATLSK